MADCIHCGESMMCGKGVAHHRCSRKAQRMLDLVDEMIKHRDLETTQTPEHYAAWDKFKRMRYAKGRVKE